MTDQFSPPIHTALFPFRSRLGLSICLSLTDLVPAAGAALPPASDGSANLTDTHDPGEADRQTDRRQSSSLAARALPRPSDEAPARRRTYPGNSFHLYSIAREEKLAFSIWESRGTKGDAYIVCLVANRPWRGLVPHCISFIHGRIAPSGQLELHACSNHGTWLWLMLGTHRPNPDFPSSMSALSLSLVVGESKVRRTSVVRPRPPARARQRQVMVDKSSRLPHFRYTTLSILGF